MMEMLEPIRGQWIGGLKNDGDAPRTTLSTRQLAQDHALQDLSARIEPYFDFTRPT
ncbi:MAG: hypothetical protein RI957_2185, partial [Verrucomicrobiota bacterium]